MLFLLGYIFFKCIGTNAFLAFVVSLLISVSLLVLAAVILKVSEFLPAVLAWGLALAPTIFGLPVAIVNGFMSAAVDSSSSPSPNERDTFPEVRDFPDEYGTIGRHIDFIPPPDDDFAAVAREAAEQDAAGVPAMPRAVPENRSAKETPQRGNKTNVQPGGGKRGKCCVP